MSFGDGWATRMVFPTRAFSDSCVSSFGFRSTIRMNIRPKPSRLRVAMLRFWYVGCSRPPQFQFANDCGGIFGRLLHKWPAHSWQSHATFSVSPTPAQAGLVSFGSPSVTPSAAPRGTLGNTGTRLVLSNQRMCGYLGCCTVEAWSSSSGAIGTTGTYSSTSRREWISSAGPR